MTPDLIATVARSLNGSTQHHREQLVAAVIAAIDSSGTHRVVPAEPTRELLDRAVSLALNEPLSGDNPWSKFSREIYGRMLSALPKQEAASDE